VRGACHAGAGCVGDLTPARPQDAARRLKPHQFRDFSYLRLLHTQSSGVLYRLLPVFWIFCYKPRMTPEQVKARIKQLHAETHVEVTDLTGTMDHYQVLVVSPAFEGKMMIEQQKMIMGLLKAEIDTEEVHALTMKTYTPAQYQKFGGK